MEDPRFQVVLPDPSRTPLLGLILADVLRRAARDPVKTRRLGKLRGALRVRAGGMSAVLGFEGNRVVVAPGGDQSVKAEVAGGLDALADISLGASPIWAYLARRVHVRGNVFFLLRVLPLLRVDGGSDQEQGTGVTADPGERSAGEAGDAG